MTNDEAIKLAVELERAKVRKILGDVVAVFEKGLHDCPFKHGVMTAVEEIEARVLEEWGPQDPLEGVAKDGDTVGSGQF